MSTLHQLNHPGKLNTCLPLLATGDRLLLIESAVALAASRDFLLALPEGVQLLALAQDLQARGLQQHLPTAVSSISDEQWVSLSLEVERVISW
ncbi:sulfurtransferase complex subunit TusB [Marinospirillum alkaliphilum]|uniref:Sulfur relay protein TusB/DsrH n=1 Tax=Marinospirillum alkaliphilum DSM 21637 TaxID=1122209 RepID=A0A1K1TVN0_9GAMM|nr:sulfurtransferase complex subunit TusB [Marinospirillum alkaliphilum]SFX04364.1 sulfur relay protein TusB/DsrH [Marinospirillum alkaliphilum DSM 21637]